MMKGARRSRIALRATMLFAGLLTFLVGKGDGMRPLFEHNARAASQDELDELLRRPAQWQSIDVDTVKQLVRRQIVLSTIPDDAVTSASLSNLYAVFVDRVPHQERLELLLEVSEEVEDGTIPVRGLLPFLVLDPGAGVVGTASLSLAVLMPPRGGDVLTGPKFLCELAGRTRDDTRRGRILVGLLLLGDQRAVQVLRGCWGILGPSGRMALSTAWSGFAYKAVVDFFVEWLERSLEREGEFGSVAGTLARLALKAERGIVVDVERKFPANAPDGREPARILRQWTVAEYGLEIIPRLRALAQRERAPKIIPQVIQAWSAR